MKHVLALALAAAAAAALSAAPARAEMPANHGLPELTGRAAVGWGVVGHNGTWLYADGSACGLECVYSFSWERCTTSGCRAIAGAIGRVYKVRRVDVGARMRVIVWVTKYDCGEWNYSTGTRECRFVTRNAASPMTDAVPAPPKPKPKPRPRPKPSGRP